MRVLPSFVLARMRKWPKNAGEHPDAELLTAFAEQNLSRGERIAVLKHLAGCSGCRDVLALRSAPPVGSALGSAVVRGNRIRWEWRIAAAASSLCIGLAAFWQVTLLSRSPAITSASKTEQIADASPKAPTVLPVAPPVIVKQGAKKVKRTARSFDEVSSSQRSTAPPARSDLAAPKRANETRQSVVIADELVQHKQSIDTISNSFVPGSLQKQAVIPNPRFTSQSNVAPVNAFLQAPRPHSQVLWSIEALPNGMIRKSENDGRTWQTIQVDGVTRLYALSAKESSVWTGGSGGKLFHSLDGGVSWIPVQLSFDDEPIADRIVRIDTRDESVRLETASGLTFTTTDGGAHWKRQ